MPCCHLNLALSSAVSPTVFVLWSNSRLELCWDVEPTWPPSSGVDRLLMALRLTCAAPWHLLVVLSSAWQAAFSDEHLSMPVQLLA